MNQSVPSKENHIVPVLAAEVVERAAFGSSWEIRWLVDSGAYSHMTLGQEATC